jgi:hypothetical protein
MKIIFTIISFALAMGTFANKEDDKKEIQAEKQKVYSIIKQQKSLEWYAIQAKLWKAEIDADENNVDAWLNYYTAKRMHKIMGGGSTQEELNKIVGDVQKQIPGTYEAHYIKGWNTNIGDDKITHLEKAYSIDPTRPDTYDGMLTHYELTRNKTRVSEFCSKIFEANYISPQIYAWNYNMLNSLENEAIVITAGDNDTYPAWVLQQAKEVRTDVKVLNLALLGIDDYRERLFAEMNIAQFDLTKAATALQDIKKANIQLCEHIRAHSKQPVYFAASCNKYVYDEFKDNLYLVGLAFKWTENSFDNIAILRKNYEKNFLKDNLKIALSQDLSETVVDQMNGSYIMPLITLHNHYQETEESNKLEEVAGILGSIAKKAGKEEAVEEIINPKENEVVSMVATTFRDAIYGFVQINDSLYASQMETTEWSYERFLLDLLKQKRYDDLAIAKSEMVNWEDLLIPQYKDLTEEKYFEHGKPGDDHFPVVNVTYEAAVLYGEWLTKIYNGFEHKKKKYKKVVFRLPTEEEWIMIARGGNDKKYKYPWGAIQDEEWKGKDLTFNHDNVMNQKGCYLANIQTNKPVINKDSEGTQCPVHDGGVFPVPASSYNPNDYGLFCVIGNVAEMIDQKGVTKGGSWNSQPENATIQAKESYEIPSATVGFRMVMIVLEN